jgi:hypothetical protein
MSGDAWLVFEVIFWVWFVKLTLPIVWGFLDGFLDARSGEPFDDERKD